MVNVVEVKTVRRHWRERVSKPRLYLSPRGESVLENFLVGRRSRPVDLFRAVIPSILEQAGLDPNLKVRWSQKAGCSCGCSPGFIIQTYPRDLDVYATYEATAEELENRAAVEILAERKQPGRGPSGKLRNFDAMGAEKLRVVIDNIEQAGGDEEALVAAQAALIKKLS